MNVNGPVDAAEILSGQLNARCAAAAVKWKASEKPAVVLCSTEVEMAALRP